jgi:hypothetical protein
LNREKKKREEIEIEKENLAQHPKPQPNSQPISLSCGPHPPRGPAPHSAAHSFPARPIPRPSVPKPSAPLPASPAFSASPSPRSSQPALQHALRLTARARCQPLLPRRAAPLFRSVCSASSVFRCPWPRSTPGSRTDPLHPALTHGPTRQPRPRPSLLETSPGSDEGSIPNPPRNHRAAIPAARTPRIAPTALLTCPAPP